MKTYTTSAQKTLQIPIEDILQKLEHELTKTENVEFKQTKNVNILKAKMKDGSTLAIAAFEKENGATLAMIDHENVSSATHRETLQTKWRNKLDELFEE